MVLSMPIPDDIIEAIIDQLQNDHKTLRRTSLVSTSFLPRSQAHIFATIRIHVARDNDSFERSQRLHNVFLMAPHITLYVREVYLTGFIGSTWSLQPRHQRFSEEVFPGILSLLPRVRRFILSLLSRGEDEAGPLRGRSWVQQSDSLQKAIVNLCTSPSTTYLSLSHIQEYPVSALARCSGLKHLSLRGLEFQPNASQIMQTDSKQNSITSLEMDNAQSQLKILEIDGSFKASLPPLVGVLEHPHSLINRSQLRALKLVGSLPDIDQRLAWDAFELVVSTVEFFMWNQAVDWNERTGTANLYPPWTSTLFDVLLLQI
jgi:hypothetical protein